MHNKIIKQIVIIINYYYYRKRSILNKIGLDLKSNCCGTINENFVATMVI